GLGVKRFGEPFQPELRNKRVKGTKFFQNLVLSHRRLLLETQSDKLKASLLLHFWAGADLV
ncbi:hypothetical protein DHL47_04325, partial [Streptococcus panodentis]